MDGTQILGVAGIEHGVKPHPRGLPGIDLAGDLFELSQRALLAEQCRLLGCVLAFEHCHGAARVFHQGGALRPRPFPPAQERDQGGGLGAFRHRRQASAAIGARGGLAQLAG